MASGGGTFSIGGSGASSGVNAGSGAIRFAVVGTGFASVLLLAFTGFSDSLL